MGIYGLALLLLAVAGACELLAAFHVALGAVDLVPLGLVFLIAAVAFHHHG